MNDGDFEEFNENQESRIFEFSSYCWLLVLALAVWVVYFASATPYLDVADFIGFGVRVVVAAVIPGILGFAGWFLFGRSNTAATTIYMIVFLALGWHAYLGINATAVANEKAAGLAALPQPMSGAAILAMVAADKPITADHIWKKPGNPREDSDDEAQFGSLELITKSHLSKMSASIKEYIHSVGLLDVEVVINGKRYISESFIEREKISVQRYLDAIAKFRPVAAGEAAAYEKELGMLGFSDDAKEEIMAAYNSSSEKWLPTILEICDTDKDRGDAVMEILETLEKDWGKWKYDRLKQATKFDSSQSQQLYDELLKMIETTARDRKKLLVRLGGG